MPAEAETSDDGAKREVDRLRRALERRGPVETRLAANRGQRAIVRERDRVISELIRAVDMPVGRLLDVGCGDGATLGRLVAEGTISSGVGVDLLPERIEGARARWPAIRFEVTDATRLPFPDGSFDAVLTMTVFSSVQQPARRAMAAEIARVVRPGGGFIWYDMRLPSPSNPDVRPFSATDVAGLFPGWPMQVRRLTVAPPIARHLGVATDRLYPLLALSRALLSHEAGVAQRPVAS